jgi:RimJ/RimL family protein N-acetyltransferase
MREVGGPARDWTDEYAARWFARMVDPGDGANCYCLIFARAPERPVGEVSFHQFDRAAGTAVFNVKVEAVERGKGYGPDAMRTLLAFFFGPCGGRIMRDPLAPDNRVGQQALLRFGFVPDPDGSAEECLLQITREAFIARYSAL